MQVITNTHIDPSTLLKREQQDKTLSETEKRQDAR